MKEYWKDDARWTRYIKGFKALNVTVHKSTSAMFRLLIAGEYSIAMPSLLHDVIEEKEKGSPVDFVRSAAPVISAQQLGIYGKAPHMNGAKLFAEWMITPEGQMAVAAVGRETSRKGIKSKASIEYAWGNKVKPIPIVKSHIPKIRESGSMPTSNRCGRIKRSSFRKQCRIFCLLMLVVFCQAIP